MVDLPGTYSLAARAPDELIAVSVLLGRGKGVAQPDVIVCVVDATNLDRNLYLATQVIDIGLPLVIALTMTDLADKQGLQFNIPELERRLGVPIVPVHAVKRSGLARLRQAIRTAAQETPRPPRPVRLPTPVEHEAEALSVSLAPAGLSAAFAERVLLDTDGLLEHDLIGERGSPARTELQAARQRLATAGIRLPQVEVTQRYAWIAQTVAAGLETRTTDTATTPPWSERIDALVTHKVWGLAIFLLTMAVTFQSIFSWAVPAIDAVDGLFSALGAWVGGSLAEGPLRSLIVDGIIGGVGAVVVFVPQIAILFGLIGLLEDSGYMAGRRS